MCIGLNLQHDYQTRDYYNIQTQKLQAEVNAHLYSVSQRLPQLSSYNPIRRHNDWDKHSDVQKTLQNETKERNSSDPLEKSIMGSNMSSYSNQTASSSTAARSFSTTEKITSGNSTFSAISPPLPGTDAARISLPPLSCLDLPQRRLANKLSRLALATHDGRGHLLGGAGQ